MTDDIRKRLQIIEWFLMPEPHFAGAFAGLAGIVAVAGLGMASRGSLPGLLAFLTGAIWLGFQHKSANRSSECYVERPALKQMEQWLDEDLEQVARAGLGHLGISGENLSEGEWHCTYRPIDWVSGYGPGSDLDPGHRCASRASQETDQPLFLFSCWHITAVISTGIQCAVFECDYNWLINTVINKCGSRFPVQQIAVMRWSRFSEQGLWNKHKKVFGRKLDLVLQGGVSLSLLLPEAPCHSTRDEKIKLSTEKVIATIGNLAAFAQTRAQEYSIQG